MRKDLENLETCRETRRNTRQRSGRETLWLSCTVLRSPRRSSQELRLGQLDLASIQKRLLLSLRQCVVFIKYFQRRENVLLFN